MDLPEESVASSCGGVSMFNRITKWMLKIVNRRICSVDDFQAILKKMEDEAQYDGDGFIAIGELVKLLMKSFRAVRLGKYD